MRAQVIGGNLFLRGGWAVRARRVRWWWVELPGPTIFPDSPDQKTPATATGYRRPRGLRSKLGSGLLALRLALLALLRVLGLLLGLAGLRLLWCSAVRCLRRRDRWLCCGLQRRIVIRRLRSIGRLQLLRVVGALLGAALATRALRSARVVDGYPIALIGCRVRAAVVPVWWATGHIRWLHRECRPTTGTAPGTAAGRPGGCRLPSGTGQRRDAYARRVIPVDHQDPGQQDRRHGQHGRGPSQPRRQPQWFLQAADPSPDSELHPPAQSRLPSHTRTAVSIGKGVSARQSDT